MNRIKAMTKERLETKTLSINRLQHLRDNHRIDSAYIHTLDRIPLTEKGINIYSRRPKIIS